MKTVETLKPKVLTPHGLFLAFMDAEVIFMIMAHKPLENIIPLALVAMVFTYRFITTRFLTITLSNGGLVIESITGKEFYQYKEIKSIIPHNELEPEKLLQIPVHSYIVGNKKIDIGDVDEEEFSRFSSCVSLLTEIDKMPLEAEEV